MKSNNHFIERRKFPRYYPDKKNQPRVSFIFDNGEKISVEVINISRGGMLASTTEMEHFLEMDQQKIKIIEIIPPDRKPFRCAGNLLRLHPMREDNRCYCAIEFRKIGEEDIKKEHPRQGSNTDTRSAEQADLEIKNKILNRVSKASNYTKTEDQQRAMEIRKSVYNSFADITDHLSLEDKWWFFELLDEMKRREPDYHEALKEDFLNLCLKGLKNGPDQDNGTKLGLITK